MKICALCFLLIIFSASMSFNACGTKDISLIEKKYGEDKLMSKKILIAYATRAGSTAEIADFIGKSIAGNSVTVDVKPLKSIRDITGYQAVVLGSAVRQGRLLPEIVKYVKLHKADLQKIPVAYFVVCMTMKEDTKENRKTTNAYIDPLRSEISPVDTGLFAGKMDYSKLGFLNYIIIKYMVKVPEGDFRDWDVIKTWSNNLLPKLISTMMHK